MSRGRLVIELRNGSFFRGPRSTSGGTLGEAMRFNQARHAERYADREAQWIWFHGGMVREIGGPR